MNFYPFHIGDYLAHTSHLEPMEDLAYRRLLDAYYIRECCFPVDISEIARLIRMKQFESDVKRVLCEFFDQTEFGWAHSRCDQEIARMREKQAKARASAQVSVSVRSANAQRSFSERSTKAELPTPTPTPKRNTCAAAQPDGVSESVWQDFKELRKRLKAPITQTALDGIAREAAKKRLSLEDALRMCCERSWRGFKADWVPDSELPKSNEPDPVLEKLKHDAEKAIPIPENIKAKLGSLVDHLRMQ